MKFVLLIFGLCILCMLFGIYIGYQRGKIRGMEEFLSVIKVYDDGHVMNEISSLLNGITKLSDEEKFSKFTDYVAHTYYGSFDDDVG